MFVLSNLSMTTKFWYILDVSLGNIFLWQFSGRLLHTLVEHICRAILLSQNLASGSRRAIFLELPYHLEPAWHLGVQGNACWHEWTLQYNLQYKDRVVFRTTVVAKGCANKGATLDKGAFVSLFYCKDLCAYFLLYFACSHLTCKIMFGFFDHKNISIVTETIRV